MVSICARNRGADVKQSPHIETRHKLKDIARIDTFNALIDSCTLSDEEKELLRLHYIQHKTFIDIGEILGYSESTLKAKHRKILRKLDRLI